MKNVLLVDSVRKSFNKNVILSDISIYCKTGNVIALYGRNGSGKTTLLKIIFGSEKLQNKFISINDKVYNKPYKKCNLINFSPSFLFLPRNITVKNIASQWLEQKRIKQIEKDETISPYLNIKIKHLSNGLRKYLQVKLILLKEAKFCLLDEPYLGLSPINIEKINELIQQVSSSKGIIIADHNYHNLSSISNKAYLLKEGVIRIIKNKQDLIDCGYINA